MQTKKFGKTNIPRRKFLNMSLKGGVALAAAPSILTQFLSCSGAGKAVPEMAVDPELVNTALKKALQKGGDFADVYFENRVSRRILMEESKFKSAVYGISQGAGVRVIAGDKTGFAYTDDISPQKLAQAAEVASFIAQSGKATSPVAVTVSSRPSYISVRDSLEEVADAKRLEIMQRANQAALEYDPRIKMASISYYDEVRFTPIKLACTYDWRSFTWNWWLP